MRKKVDQRPERQATSAARESRESKIRDKALAVVDRGAVLFDRFWKAYPRKQSKEGARRKFESLTRKDQALAESIITGAERYRDDPNREAGYTKLPTTWLNNGCWEDELLPSRDGWAELLGPLGRAL